MFEAVLFAALSLHSCASFDVNSVDSARAAHLPPAADLAPPPGWNFAFGPIAYEDWAGYATFKPVAALCKKPETFFDGNGLEARHIIIQAFVENQASSIVYAVGTKDGGEIDSIINQSWYNASKIHIHGSEASGVVAHFLDQRFAAHPEVNITHTAVSDVNNHSYRSFGPDTASGSFNPTTSWTQSREVTTKRMSTILSEFMADNVPGMQDHFDYVWVNAEGTSETRAILGMSLTGSTLVLSNGGTHLVDGLSDRFPLIQFELGSNWLDFSPVDYSQDRQSGPVTHDDPASITTQQDMIRHLESEGYAVFLMGKDQDLPLLIRIHEEFVHQATCVQDPNGKGFFLPGNALAVHWTIYNQNASHFQTHVPPQVIAAITPMVVRGQTYIQNQYLV